MDPHVAWRDMQRELMAENWEIAVELAEALLAWLKGGGFPPMVGDPDLPYGWHRQLAEAGAKYVLTAASLEQIDDEAEQEEQAECQRRGQP